MRLKVGPCQSGMEIHAYNSIIQEGETEGFPKVQGHFGLHSELEASPVYISVTTYLPKPKDQYQLQCL